MQKAILEYLIAQYPNSPFSIGGDTYESIDWQDKDVKIPTKAAVLAGAKLLEGGIALAEATRHFKQLYLKVINDKLKELDYDSLATVKLWADDATFGVEAMKILDWYKAVVNYNYALITAGVIPTDEVYLADMPKYV
jgi:hypothetical protein